MHKDRQKKDYKLLKAAGMKVAAVSLGCAKNRIDTEEILGLLASLGFVLTDDYRHADIVLANTCSFIDPAKKESINTLRDLAAHKSNPTTKIIAAGCLVETFGINILKCIPDIDGAIGVHSYSHIEKFLKIILNGKRAILKRPPGERYHSLFSRILTTPAHSVNVKIAEGCSNFCHYCLIPKIRGHYRSRRPDDIIAEIKYLLENGTREINLIAQDTTAFGSDLEDRLSFSGLIKRILELKHNFWLRIMYTYPSRIDDSLIELMAKERRICKYLDVPIQHANNEILTKMGRSYGKEELKELFLKLRKKVPNIAIRTTCMVGYPGEKREQFDELLDFIEDYPFEWLGAFAYSAQKGTSAGNAHNQLPQRIIKRRFSELMKKQQQISYRFNLDMIGKRLVLVVDKAFNRGENWYYGRSEYQAPEVDGGVLFRSDIPLKQGDWVSAEICAASPYNLLATKPLLLKELPT